MRKKRLIYNTLFSIINQLVTLICGFLIPRQILLTYGSDVNGLVSSITQFLGVITIMDMGVGAVVQTALYKPLAENDQDSINRIMKQSNVFFRLIGICLIGYTLVLSIVYPLCVDSVTGKFSTIILIIAISFSSFSQYFFGITNQLLLNADQKLFVPLITSTLTTILNTVLTILLISYKIDIAWVKLFSSFVLLIRPLTLYIYVKTHYHIKNVSTKNAPPLPQKYSGMGQHIATFIVDRTDVIVLTLFSTLTIVSIYNVYGLVVTAIYQMALVVVAGLQSLLGNMYAKKEDSKMSELINQSETLFHLLVLVLFICCGVLIPSFAKVYTAGVEDAEYYQPVFGWLLSGAYFLCSLRGYYNMIIKAIGHYKQTQLSAYIEAAINITISLSLVSFLGLIGVAIGTIIAMGFRTIYLAIYINKNINGFSLTSFLKKLLLDLICILCAVIFCIFVKIQAFELSDWIIKACIITCVVFVICLSLYLLFEIKTFKSIIKYFKKNSKDI